MDRFYFKTLSALVAEENIRLFSFWSPSLLLLLLEYLEKNSEKILKTLKEKRKQEVRKYIEAKEYHKIWKNLILISCWGDMNSTSVPVTISSFVGVKVTVESPPDAILNAFSLATSIYLLRPLA